MLSVVLLALSTQAVGPYDADPNHPWNRLHRALFTWQPKGTAPVPAGPVDDPLFWPLGPQLYDFPAGLTALLEEVLKSDERRPLPRAVLQHDLWMYFDALDGQYQGGGRSIPPGDDALRADVRRLFAKILRRIALTPAEIDALPETLAASKRYPATFDATVPERPFLPATLFDPQGPWVLVGRKDAPAAAEHVRHFAGRSVFLLFLSVPDGREATVKYLETLRDLKRAKAPEPPAGTALALVRRAFLLDRDGEPRLSPLTEEVRLRVPGPKSAEPSARQFEFHLRRRSLFADAATGLEAAGVEEEGPVFFFHRGAAAGIVRRTCSECHGLSAVPISTVKVSGRELMLRDGQQVGPGTVAQEVESTLKWKKADRTWEALRKAWPKDP